MINGRQAMQGWTLIIIGVILLIVGLALLNIPFSFEGAVALEYLGWALIVIGVILIVVGIIFLIRPHVH